MFEELMQRVGQTVDDGRFRLDRALEQGGMGAVFAGTEVATGRSVAVKLMHPGFGEEPQYLARFRREAEIMGRLSHPHVVEVVATGGGEGAPPFIAMELLAGASIHTRLKNGETFDEERAIQIARQVLSALTAAHAIGVVHRDLKPGNVMLADGPDGPIAKIVDFGVARLATTDAMTRLTATGQVLGTPSYMAPEQAMGVPADARCDVYAVGAIMHRLLAGEPPFGRGRYGDILSRLVADEREPIHGRVPGLGPVADIVERALTNELQNRYQSAAEMDDALALIDPASGATILDWRPPFDLATLRLPPEREHGEAPQLSAVPWSAETVSAESRPRPLLRIRNVVLVVGAVVLGAVGAFVVLTPRRGAAPADAVPAVPFTLSAELPLTPAAPIAPVLIGGDVTSEAPTPADHEGESARPRHRRPPAPRVQVTVSGYNAHGVARGTGQQVMAQLNATGNLTECWPRRDPLPQSSRGATFGIVIGAGGRIENARQVGSMLYPAFERCMTAKLLSTTLTGQDLEGEMRISFSFRPG